MEEKKASISIVITADNTSEEKKGVDKNLVLTTFVAKKIILGLDLWRGLIYGVALEEIIRENFNKIPSFKWNLKSFFIDNLSFFIFLFACVLTISEPIIRYLYRDLTMKEIADHNSDQELWLAFFTFAFEIAALLFLCFGIQGLSGLEHWHYLIPYFVCNILINWIEGRKIFLKRYNEEKQKGIKLSIKASADIIFNGKMIDFFLLGKSLNQIEIEQNSQKNIVYKNWRRKIWHLLINGFTNFTNQYIAFNTIFLSLILGICFFTYEHLYNLGIPIISEHPLTSFWTCLIVILGISTQPNRNFVFNGAMSFAYLGIFLSLLYFSHHLLYGRCVFIAFCFLHYIIVSFCYLRLYIQKLFLHIVNIISVKAQNETP